MNPALIPQMQAEASRLDFTDLCERLGFIEDALDEIKAVVPRTELLQARQIFREAAAKLRPLKVR